jgi:hypothetical protein
MEAAVQNLDDRTIFDDVDFKALNDEPDAAVSDLQAWAICFDLTPVS